MKPSLYLIPILFILLESCAQETKQDLKVSNEQAKIEVNSASAPIEMQNIIEPSGNTLETRILPPIGFKRIPKQTDSYAEYLRQLPLKPHGSEVLLYNGATKPNDHVYVAVVDLEIGKKDLHQCADAVMRLRAEYLWQQKRYEEIHFNFTNGFRVDYSNWMKGQRMVVKGNKTYWVDKALPSNTYQDFWNYMELIFSYAGTLSLSKELITVELEKLKIGDVFIWGGSPGHAVLVVDVAVNEDTHEKVFLLAQSYMPAQEIQILQNPNHSKLSPWYVVSEIKEELYTPEWNFVIQDLKRFKE